MGIFGQDKSHDEKKDRALADGSSGSKLQIALVSGQSVAAMLPPQATEPTAITAERARHPLHDDRAPGGGGHRQRGPSARRAAETFAPGTGPGTTKPVVAPVAAATRSRTSRA